MDLIALEEQSFLDLALAGGNIEAILSLNNNISITDSPVIGKTYTIEILDKRVSDYYKVYNLQPTTFLTKEDLNHIITVGIGTMAIENNFIIGWQDQEKK